MLEVNCCVRFIQYFARYVFYRQWSQMSTDLKETVKSMNFVKCNPLWGFKDMGCRQHICKTPRVILFEVCTMDLKYFGLCKRIVCKHYVLSRIIVYHWQLVRKNPFRLTLQNVLSLTRFSIKTHFQNYFVVSFQIFCQFVDMKHHRPSRLDLSHMPYIV